MSPEKKLNDVVAKKAMQARIAVGLSLSEAARLLGFNNYQTLSGIEKGARKVTADELSVMASIYKRSLDYFFEPEVFHEPKPLWRKSAKVDTSRIERSFITFIESYGNLEKLLGLESRWKDVQRNYGKADFRERGFELTDRLGSEFWSTFNLGARPSANLLSVLENDLRFKILHLDLPEGVSGASVVHEDVGVGILINGREVPWRRNFDLAHELFHVITWKAFSHQEVGDGTKRTLAEKCADGFASSLLLPKDSLLSSLSQITNDGQIKFIDIIELAKDYGVSTEAILWRLVNLRKLSQRDVARVLANRELAQTDRFLRRRLYAHQASKFPERFIFIACRCLLEGKISRGVFASYLEINRAEIDEYLKKQGFEETTYEKVASAGR